MQTEDLKESSKQTTAEETPQQEAQTNTADAANGVDETAGKRVRELLKKKLLSRMKRMLRSKNCRTVF